MLCLSMPTTLLANLSEFHDDDDDDDDDVDDNDDNDDDEGKQWHGMDRAISFCTHTIHTDERPYIPTWTVILMTTTTMMMTTMHTAVLMII